MSFSKAYILNPSVPQYPTTPGVLAVDRRMGEVTLRLFGSVVVRLRVLGLKVWGYLQSSGLFGGLLL